MTTKRANEITQLIRRLGSRKQVSVDAARARLSVIGARSVEALIEALEGDNDRIRINALQLLALIGDTRGQEPLAAMLLDRSPTIRANAARALARFPSRNTVVTLERTLLQEKHAEVREASIHGLLELFDAGRDEALRQVLAVLFDDKEDTRLRLAAFGLFPRLNGNERRSIIRRLQEDPDARIAERARKETDSAEEAQRPGTSDLLDDLDSSNYGVWNEAVRGLTSLGAAAVIPIVEEMQRRSNDPEYCTRAGMVLKGLGPRRCRSLAEILDAVDEPLPLMVLVDVIGALGVRSLVYRFKDLIERISSMPSSSVGENGFDPMQRVRAKAHLELARIGSRVAIRELRGMLADPNRRLEIEILAALELIGKKDELPDLLRAFRREEGFIRARIAETVRSIMRRERIRRNSRMLRELSDEQRQTMAEILELTDGRGRSPRRTN